MDGDGNDDRSLYAYYVLLRDNGPYRTLLIGEVINHLGAWFNLVATLELLGKLAGDSGLLLSLVIIMRFLPSFLLFPFAGVVADRYDRVKVVVFTCIADGLVAAALTLVWRPQELWLLYVLVFLQFAAAAFYEPARQALTPLIVPKHQLALAATLDSFAWSVMAAFGASLGGFALSKLGTSACFLTDAATYFVAAGCSAYLLRVEACKHGGEPRDQEAEDSSQHSALLHDTSWSLESDDADKQGAAVKQAVKQQQHQQPAMPHGPASSGGSSTSSDGTPAVVVATVESGRSQEGKHQPADGAALEHAEDGGGLSYVVAHGLEEEVKALRDGLAYICARGNRDVAALVLIKGSGALCWGASDIFNVRFADMPEMQSLGDSAMTLGFIFTSVGVGCIVGPLVFNRFTPSKVPHLLRSTALSFTTLVVGYAVLAVSPNIWWVLLSTCFRSTGTSTLWVYAQLLIQLRVPNELLGRMMALDMAFFTVGEAISGTFGGLAFDVLHMTVRQACGVMAVVAAVVTAGWVAYAWVMWIHYAKVADGMITGDEENGSPTCDTQLAIIGDES